MEPIYRKALLNLPISAKQIGGESTKAFQEPVSFAGKIMYLCHVLVIGTQK